MLRRTLVLAAVPALVSVLSACLPIPVVHAPLRVPAPAYRMAPDAVSSDVFTVPGAREPHTPPSLDATTVLRWRADEPARAVLVLVPGLFGGAGSLEILARQLVASTPGLQVWVVDRRSNALEDHRGFERARAARDPDAALAYYLGAPGRPAVFHEPDPRSVAYMAYWGLRVHLEDLSAVVDRARQAAPAVYLGGHSLGASLAALYAAFLRDDGRPGCATLDGLVLLDGAPGRTGAFDLPDAVEGRRLLGVRLVPSLEELASGRVAPYLGPGIVPPRILRSEVIATFARYRPDDLAPAALADYPVTNLALAGIDADDTYAELPTFAPSLGEAVGAATAGNVLPFLLEGAYGARSRTVVGASPGAGRVTWSAGDPPAATDLRSYVRSATGPHADRAEWYFPVRLLIDMSVLSVDLDGVAGFVPSAEVTVPTLAIGAGKGMIESLDGFSAYANARVGSTFTGYVVPGLTHIDLVTAAAAPVATLFARWAGLARP